METATAFDNLNDDCLAHIFSFLPFEDVTRFERVCKKWQRVSLIVNRKFTITKERLKADQFEGILKKYGENMISLCLDLEEFIDNLVCFEDVMKIIQNYSTGRLKILRIISFKGYFHICNLNSPQLPFLKNLEKLDFYLDFDASVVMDSCPEFVDQILLFRENALNMEKFRIRTCLAVLRRFSFEKFGRKLEVDCFVPEQLDRLFQTFPEVTDLKICIDIFDGCSFAFHMDCFKKISNNLESLEIVLEVYSFENEEVKDCFKGYQTVQFNNLKTLKLKKLAYSVHDDVILHFTRTCPLLEDLCLNECLKITEVGYGYLRNFKQLKVLELELRDFEINSSLEVIAAECTKLEKIIIRFSKWCITKLKSLIELLPNLKYIKVKQIENLSEKGFRDILETVNDRENGVKLEIFFTKILEELEQFRLKKMRTLYSEPDNNLTITWLNYGYCDHHGYFHETVHYYCVNLE